jgi:hypothetical protein
VNCRLLLSRLPLHHRPIAGLANSIQVEVRLNFFCRMFLIALSVLFYAAICCDPAAAQLETRVSTPFLADSDPASFAVADFNNDGKLDIASTGSELQVFLGIGDGTFQAPINYTVGSAPSFVAVADFNGDGKLDLAVTNYLSSTVSILFGNGDGTFQLVATLKTEIGPLFIAAGDFNGDHKPDLVVQEEYYVTVFLNKGDGTFGRAINTKTTEGPDAIGVGDFNRDGTLDLAVAENTPTAASINILLGNGDGTFRIGASYPVLTSPRSIAVADFRDDGVLDLAVADFLGAGISVLLGNGDGTFGSAVTYTSDFADWVTTGDFNGDGKPDIIVSNNSDNGFPTGSVSILLGNGDGTFQPQMVFPAGFLSNFVGVGDFNGDKKLDIVDMDPLFGDLITMLNTGAVSFSPTSPITFPTTLIGTTSVPLTATLTNSGTATMTVSSVKCSGAPFAMTKTTCKGSIAPGGKCSFTTNFTAQVEGTVSGTVTFKDSASSKPQVVELVGTGTVVEFSPPQLKFPPQKVGTTSGPMTIQVTDTGTDPLNFTHFIFINGKNYLDFSQSDNCGSQIGPGASCTITVTFTPRKTGKRSAFVEIEDDGGGSPQQPALVGTGD